MSVPKPWHAQWRGFIRSTEVATIIALWATGFTTGDIVNATILLVGGLFVGALAIHVEPKWAIRTKLLMFVCLFMWMSLSIGIVFWRQTSSTGKIENKVNEGLYSKEERAKIDEQITLRELFENDFPDYGVSGSRGNTKYSDTGESYQFDRKVIYDVNSASHFLSIHLPNCRDVVGIAKYILQNIEVFASYKGTYSFTINRPGDSTQIKSSSFKFSNVVYLYVENTISNIDKGEIESNFIAKGITAHVYDTYYVLAKLKDQQTVSLIQKRRRDAIDFTKRLSQAGLTPTPPALPAETLPQMFP